MLLHGKTCWKRGSSSGRNLDTLPGTGVPSKDIGKQFYPVWPSFARVHVLLQTHSYVPPLTLVPLTVKFVHRTPSCSHSAFPETALPSALKTQSFRQIATFPLGSVTATFSTDVPLLKVAVPIQVVPSLWKPEKVLAFFAGS